MQCEEAFANFHQGLVDRHALLVRQIDDVREKLLDEPVKVLIDRARHSVGEKLQATTPSLRGRNQPSAPFKSFSARTEESERSRLNRERLSREIRQRMQAYAKKRLSQKLSRHFPTNAAGEPLHLRLLSHRMLMHVDVLPNDASS